MKKILLIMMLLLVTGCGNKLWSETVDSKKFKEEYEALNGTKNSNDVEYLTVNVNKKNPMVYLDYNEMVEFIQNGSGLLYFGRPGCPYCRGTLNAMFEFALENKITKIYYYNPEEIRTKNNDEYKQLLNLLGDHLSVDLVTQKEEDENFDPNLKRIVLPSLFFVNNGKIIGNYTESRPEYKEKINEKQKENLIEKYQELYDEYKADKGQCTLEC